MHFHSNLALECEVLRFNNEELLFPQPQHSDLCRNRPLTACQNALFEWKLPCLSKCGGIQRQKETSNPK